MREKTVDTTTHQEWDDWALMADCRLGSGPSCPHQPQGRPQHPGRRPPGHPPPASGPCGSVLCRPAPAMPASFAKCHQSINKQNLTNACNKCYEQLSSAGPHLLQRNLLQLRTEHRHFSFFLRAQTAIHQAATTAAASRTQR